MSDRTVFHVPEDDEDYGKKALRNASNLLDDETVDVEVSVVANGDGVAHLLDEASTADDVRELLAAGVDVFACGNTVVAADYDEADLVDGVSVVSSGMGELTRRQADGHAYVRP